MKNLTKLQAALAACALFASSGAFSATSMTHADYSAQKDKIEAQYKSDKDACGSMSGNAKDVCVDKAKGAESVAKAQLEYSYTGKASDGAKVGTAQADADYSVSKEMCDDKAGDAKSQCVTLAKANHEKALADAKMNKKVAEARMDAQEDHRSANRKVAESKCDSMAGSAKSACMDQAKAQYPN